MAREHAADEAAIRHQIDTLAEAIRAMDVERVESIYAPDIVSFDVQPPLKVVGPEAKSRNWADAFAAFERPIDYEIRDLTIVLDGGVAFVHGLNRLTGTLRNGNRCGIWVRATACFRKIGNDWLIAHDHVSVPIDVESGRGLLDLEP